MKIYRRLRTWIMLGIVVLIPLLFSTLAYFTSANHASSNWSVMTFESTITFILVTVFTVVISADSVAGEFTWGTVKLLLIRPWSRSSILLSKYLSLLLFGLFFSAVTFVVTFAVNVLFFGYNGSPSDLGPLWTTDPWSYIALYYLYQFISLVMVVTFSFMLSSAFRSGGLSIGLSIFLLLSGSIISGILAVTDKPWVKYVLFPHLSLTSYLDGNSPIPGHPTTLGFSLSVLAVYFILFNLVSWTVFRKRDITA
ncbi:MAG: transporter permease [Cohnella sp.]|nr:transporter permease [Cohnella sp.]